MTLDRRLCRVEANVAEQDRSRHERLRLWLETARAEASAREARGEPLPPDTPDQARRRQQLDVLLARIRTQVEGRTS